MRSVLIGILALLIVGCNAGLYATATETYLKESNSTILQQNDGPTFQLPGKWKRIDYRFEQHEYRLLRDDSVILAVATPTQKPPFDTTGKSDAELARAYH